LYWLGSGPQSPPPLAEEMALAIPIRILEKHHDVWVQLEALEEAAVVYFSC
jgi:hypothetical protein